MESIGSIDKISPHAAVKEQQLVTAEFFPQRQAHRQVGEGVTP